MSRSLPPDYLERVYAGVLGKIIGVYLGRPFEQWDHDRIQRDLGDIWHYVHERLGQSLVVADDDISGTFTFVRAMEDEGCPRDLAPAAIGRAWMNYIIENQTILWWGGMGHSTEHTAFLRMKHGIEPPRSGSIELNGPVVAQQIGAQIFIDGWAMIAPGDPEYAAELARRASVVSHDGEAVYGAQVVAAIESGAFVERDLNRLIDVATGLIPRDSVIYRLIADLREVRAGSDDWHAGLRRIRERYGYDRWLGGCHMVPNHAVVMLGLLWGNDDFQTSLMIANTAGYDTDCNSGNVGCILGIKNGLRGIDASADFRTPVADRLLLPTADGGNCVTDAATQAVRLANVGRRLAGSAPQSPKGGARFHFDLPGAVQGFTTVEGPGTRGTLTLENVEGGSALGSRSLALRFRRLAPGLAARATTATFLSPEHLAARGGYTLAACPTLYPGQTVTARVQADAGNARDVAARLLVKHYTAQDKLSDLFSPPQTLAPGAASELRWTVPPTDGQPIASIGIELTGAHGVSGSVYLDTLDWSGAPDCTLGKPAGEGLAWLHAWVDATGVRIPWSAETLVCNEGRGLRLQGTRDWRDYRVSAAATPVMAKAFGLASQVQGLKRYYAVLLCADGVARLVRMRDEERVLAETAYAWAPGSTHELSLDVSGGRIVAMVGGKRLEATDPRPLDGGAVGLVCEEGRGRFGPVRIEPRR